MVELEGFEPQDRLAPRVERLEQHAKGASLVACGFDWPDGEMPGNPCRVCASALTGLEGSLDSNRIKVCAGKCQGLFAQVHPGVATVGTGNSLIERGQDDRHNRKC